MYTHTHLFFLQVNQLLSTEAGLFLIFWRFQPEVVLKLFSDFLIFPNSVLVAQNNKKTLKIRVCSCFVERYAKKNLPNCQHSLRERHELA